MSFGWYHVRRRVEVRQVTVRAAHCNSGLDSILPATSFVGTCSEARTDGVATMLVATCDIDPCLE